VPPPVVGHEPHRERQDTPAGVGFLAIRGSLGPLGAASEPWLP
jgi:hypothetical protein